MRTDVTHVSSLSLLFQKSSYSYPVILFPSSISGDVFSKERERERNRNSIEEEKDKKELVKRLLTSLSSPGLLVRVIFLPLLLFNPLPTVREKETDRDIPTTTWRRRQFTDSHAVIVTEAIPFFSQLCIFFGPFLLLLLFLRQVNWLQNWKNVRLVVMSLCMMFLSHFSFFASQSLTARVCDRHWELMKNISSLFCVFFLFLSFSV